MLYPERGLATVYNGEIYNFIELRTKLRQRGHAFHSECDTEVLLKGYAEWGPEVVAHLTGMFAFAIYDHVRQRVFFARDRAGEKPFFYRLTHGCISFASELKALLAYPEAPRRIDPVALDQYLTLGYVAGDRCILSGYRKLPPAHAMSFDLNTGSAEVWRYWQPPAFEPSSVEADQLADELENLLDLSVQGQLRADVPVGILLSGGVDSSLVTALAARHVAQVRTFTVRFPGEPNDESIHARQVANHFGTDHIELDTDPSHTVELLPALARQFDEPLADSSLIPTFLVTRSVREHCTVALGGDGGDELFGGYLLYNRLFKWQQLRACLPRMVRSSSTAIAEHVLPVGFKGRSTLRALDRDLLPQASNSLFDPVNRRRLVPGSNPFPDKLELGTPDEIGLIQWATRADFRYYLPDDILMKVDRASMLNSLELRAPFLDRHVVEFAYRQVPTSLKADASHRKILLKILTQRLLPADFDHDRKQGFGAPVQSWLNESAYRRLTADVLFQPGGIFSPRQIRRMLRWHELGVKNGHLIFSLLLFELWRLEHNASL